MGTIEEVWQDAGPGAARTTIFLVSLAGPEQGRARHGFQRHLRLGEDTPRLLRPREADGHLRENDVVGEQRPRRDGAPKLRRGPIRLSVGRSDQVEQHVRVHEDHVSFRSESGP